MQQVIGHAAAAASDADLPLPSPIHQKATEVVVRMPLTEEVAISRRAGLLVDGTVLPLPTFIRMLVSTALRSQVDGPICVILPTVEDVAPLVAMMAALEMHAVDLPAARARFRDQGLSRGQRVRLLPSGEVSEASAATVAESCRALAGAYREWIVERERELAQDTTIPKQLRARGEDNLRECRICLARIEDGIDLLLANDDAMDAFKLMNRAMVEQRAHYALSSEEKKRRHWQMTPDQASPSAPYATPDYPASTKWRPFQLAFVLMNVRSFVDPGHAERSLVDVIWFPTGGGKTEAYLGLAGFVILFGRLSAPDDAGTKVLMRYTLRLLTTQQFQRAASLICALELLRRNDPARFGPTPISIGLWVGGAVTPNNNDQALIQLGQVEGGSGENPFIVLSCPWCGIDMGPREYGSSTRVFGYRKTKTADGQRRVRFQCEDADCPFSTDAGLPLIVIDEEIYRQPPTLLIGTVDKFAMMPWNPESRAVFGIDASLAQSPPQLVIQDELHLISGPLGSMVGHYETVIDEFCTDTRGGGRIPAKIIASTATIARAKEQIQAVYGRPSALFPPQGLVAGQSFFAREASDATGRVYVGILATAVPSHVSAQVRVLSTLLQAPMLLPNPGGQIDAFVDPYWSLVVYFNSLRELGRASTLVQADIREYLNAMWDRIGVGLLHAIPQFPIAAPPCWRSPSYGGAHVAPEDACRLAGRAL